VLDQLHRGVESAEADDAIPVADVAVVEDQVARRRVVADIADVWVGSCWYAVRRRGRGSVATFSTWLKSLKVKVGGSWAGAVALSASRAVITVSTRVRLHSPYREVQYW